MLGNFSFGDYFKEQAIAYAWEFLTSVLDLPKDRLMMTYFRGADGIAADETARELWKKVTGFGEDRIRGLGLEDNFWQMGETGPCGPNSEIYFYNGPDPDPASFGNEQSPEGVGWMEIWNLVFMQFERRLDGERAVLDPLPAPGVDTGAGLERVAIATQGKLSNYDVDLLRELVEAAAALSGKRYGGSDAPDDVSMRVIADHARATAFLIAEGILPDRTGREYVLRRVMRRAVRHGHRLGIVEPFLHEVATRVVDLMGDQYPELRERRDLIRSVSESEEVRFRQTIERGLSLLEEQFGELERQNRRTLSGADAFQLYDTYGFPLDLTEVICGERGFSVDVEGYDAALAQARQRSEFKSLDKAIEGVYRLALGRLAGQAVTFSGHDRDEDRQPIVAIIKDGQLVDDVADAGAEVDLIFERTPFYGEAGGQIGDQGRIDTDSGSAVVEDTKKPVMGLTVHRARVDTGRLAVGQTARLAVDTARRERIRRNHSATHLLHWALRKILGPQAQQKGSLVGPDRFRFDFTHNRPLTNEEKIEIENLVNEQVLLNHPIHTEVMSMEQARERGATMIFEEKYGDVVRMLQIGPSRELCGGTHARATGDIGLFKIIGEQGIAAGVRRLVATTGHGSLGYVRELEETLSRAADAAKTTPAALGERIEKLFVQQRTLEKQVADLQRQLTAGDGKNSSLDEVLARARERDGVKVLGVRTQITDRGALRELAEQLRDRLGASIVLVGSDCEGKAQLVLTVSKELTERYNAARIIRPIAEIVDGSGGGRADMAQAGGSNPARLDEAIEAVHSI
jgi:alanyl-tRNA synthetase